MYWPAARLGSVRRTRDIRPALSAHASISVMRSVEKKRQINGAFDEIISCSRGGMQYCIKHSLPIALVGHTSPPISFAFWFSSLAYILAERLRARGLADPVTQKSPLGPCSCCNRASDEISAPGTSCNHAYLNLNRTMPRLKSLLRDFTWRRIGRIFLETQVA